MKKFFQILFALIATFLGGCANQQLSVDKHGERLAPRLGTKESEIQFLSYGDFIAHFDNLDRRIVAKGIIALTESDLRLETRHFRYLFSKELTTIPFHEMEGVSKIASQIHIKHGGKEIVLEFNPRFSRYGNAKESESVFQLLVSRGIPEYEVTELRRFQGYTRPRFYGDFSGVLPSGDSFDDFYSGPF